MNLVRLMLSASCILVRIANRMVPQMLYRVHRRPVPMPLPKLTEKEKHYEHAEEALAGRGRSGSRRVRFARRSDQLGVHHCNEEPRERHQRCLLQRRRATDRYLSYVGPKTAGQGLAGGLGGGGPFKRE